MFEEFYNLSTAPFRLTPDQRFYFLSQSHSRAMAYLRYGLQQGEGFIVITGAVGVGKTTLVSQLFAELDTESICAAHIGSTNLEPDDAVRLILSAFRLEPQRFDKGALLQTFERFLIEQHQRQRKVLLVVDEAQNLPRRTLEELRMLSNFAADGAPLFQCFLLAQPQFKSVLADPDLEQLRQRVIASYHMEPLQPAETREYVQHRLKIANWTGNPTIAEGLLDRIHAETGGIPRRINHLCSRLLLFGALENRRHLDEAALGVVTADMRTEIAETAGLDRSTAAPAMAPQALSEAGVVANGHAEDMLAQRVAAIEGKLCAMNDALREVVGTVIELVSATHVNEVGEGHDSSRPSSAA